MLPATVIGLSILLGVLGAPLLYAIICGLALATIANLERREPPGLKALKLA